MHAKLPCQNSLVKICRPSLMKQGKSKYICKFIRQNRSWNVSFQWLQRRVGAQFGTMTYLITSNVLYYHDGDRWYVLEAFLNICSITESPVVFTFVLLRVPSTLPHAILVQSICSFFTWISRSFSFLRCICMPAWLFFVHAWCIRMKDAIALLLPSIYHTLCQLPLFVSKFLGCPDLTVKTVLKGQPV